MILNTIVSFFQTKWWLALAALTTIFTPIFGLLWAIIIVCLVDMITAIMRDFHKYKKEGGVCRKLSIIKSRKLRRTSIKIMLYIILVCVIHLIPMVCFGVGLYTAQVAAFGIMSHELFSIGENCGVITGDNIFSKIIRKTVKRLTEYISKNMED